MPAKRHPKRHPALPASVEARLAKRTYCVISFGRSLNHLTMEEFCRDVWAERVPKRIVLRFIAGAVKLILEGKSAGNAFGMQVGKGRKRTTDRELRDQKIAAEVEELYRYWGRGSLERSIGHVAERYGLSDDSIGKIYKRYGRNRQLNRQYSAGKE